MADYFYPLSYFASEWIARTVVGWDPASVHDMQEFLYDLRDEEN